MCLMGRLRIKKIQLVLKNKFTWPLTGILEVRKKIKKCLHILLTEPPVKRVVCPSDLLEK